jgi:hypothetical protein
MRTIMITIRRITNNYDHDSINPNDVSRDRDYDSMNRKQNGIDLNKFCQIVMTIQTFLITIRRIIITIQRIVMMIYGIVMTIRAIVTMFYGIVIMLERDVNICRFCLIGIFCKALVVCYHQENTGAWYLYLSLVRPINFNKTLFLLMTGIFLLLMFAALIAVAAQDEGAIRTNQIWIGLANLFNVFRFPTHTLLSSLISLSGPFAPILFFGGLVVNCLFYAFLTERLWYSTKFMKSLFCISFIVCLTACNNSENGTNGNKHIEKIFTTIQTEVIDSPATVASQQPKLSVIVLPPYDKIANEGISPDIQNYLGMEILKDSTLSVIKFPYKLLMNVPCQSVFDKKYCNPIFDKIKADVFVMSKLDQVTHTGYMTKDKWNLRIKIFNAKTGNQINSKITVDSLSDGGIRTMLELKQRELTTEIKTSR